MFSMPIKRLLIAGLFLLSGNREGIKNMNDIGIIDERRQWLRERYEIVPIIMRRSEPVKVNVDGREYEGGIDYAREEGVSYP